MAYEDLLRSVEESAREKELALRNKATADIGEIRKRARAEAERIEQDHLDEAKKSIVSERNKLLFQTNVGNKELQIRVREAAFEKAFHEAEVRLAGVRSTPGYPGVFEKLLREATATLGSGTYSIHVDPLDADLCRKTLSSQGISAEVKTDIRTAGGMVVNLPGEAVVISNTVESRLDRARELLRTHIHSILGEG